VPRNDAAAASILEKLTPNCKSFDIIIIEAEKNLAHIIRGHCIVWQTKGDYNVY
jgi:hypothetical protein